MVMAQAAMYLVMAQAAIMAQAAVQAMMATAAQAQSALAHTRSTMAATLHSGRRLPDYDPDDEMNSYNNAPERSDHGSYIS
jgi:hypothetical protein